MARVIRLLWRLDFDVSYPYIDKRGLALQALTDTVEGFWTTVGPATLPLSFAAEKIEQDVSHTVFSWEMNNLNGSIEWPLGIDIERIFESPLVRATDRIVREALKVADVRFLNRAGIRVFCVERFATPKEGSSAVERLSRLVVEPFREGLARTLGGTNDFALVYEGTAEDGLGYRLQFGPYFRKNPEMIFSKKWGDLIEPLDANDLILDIDIYETKFSFAEHSLFRWGSTKVAKAASFMKFCATSIR
jgi:hypothetical protein